jgi:hypothetical protein
MLIKAQYKMLSKPRIIRYIGGMSRMRGRKGNAEMRRQRRRGRRGMSKRINLD